MQAVGVLFPELVYAFGCAHAAKISTAEKPVALLFRFTGYRSQAGLFQGFVVGRAEQRAALFFQGDLEHIDAFLLVGRILCVCGREGEYQQAE